MAGTIQSVRGFKDILPGEVEKWYEDQQRELFKEVFRVGFEGGEQIKAWPGLFAPFEPADNQEKPFYLTEKQRLLAAEPSPDGKYVLFTLSEDLGAKTSMVPSYVTRSGYTESVPSHTKAAENPTAYKRRGKGETKWGTERRLYLQTGLNFPRRCIYTGTVGQNQSMGSLKSSIGARSRQTKITNVLDSYSW